MSSCRIEIDDRNGGRYLRFFRQTRDGLVSRAGSALLSEQGLPSSEDVDIAKEFKSTICAGIPDETEQWRLCSPNTDQEARLALGSHGVTLAAGLVVEALHATPLNTVIEPVGVPFPA